MFSLVIALEKAIDIIKNKIDGSQLGFGENSN